MTTTDTTSRWADRIAWLREELAPRPGGGAAVARIAVSCAFTVVVAMVFQIPLPAYMAYIVLLLSRNEYIGTLISAAGGAVAATVGVVLSLLFFMVDAAEPALRIPLMALSTFVGMFLARTSALGPIAFLAGVVLVLSQLLIDGIPLPEALTRVVVWLLGGAGFSGAVTTSVHRALACSPATVSVQPTFA